MFIWAFDKNYIGTRNRGEALFIPFEQLFDLIKKQYLNDRKRSAEKIRLILDWKIMTTDNILIALLHHHLDDLAIEFMGYYSHFLDKNLFIYCMTHGNTYFL